jgi:hypothetical protein
MVNRVGVCIGLHSWALIAGKALTLLWCWMMVKEA